VKGHADSTRKAHDSTRLATGGRGRGLVTRVPDSIDTARPAPVRNLPPREAPPISVAFAEEELVTTADRLVAALQSRDERALASMLSDSTESAEARDRLLAFMRDRQPIVASSAAGEISLDGDVVRRYVTANLMWREGRIRRTTHLDYAVFRIAARRTGNRWVSEKPVVTKAPGGF
jgi:hypothetical protein